MTKASSTSSTFDIVKLNKRIACAAPLICWSLCISLLSAEESFLTAEAGGKDYALQGEFTGIIEPWGGAFGAQAIALGNNEFQIALLPGGLPGDGYRRELPKKLVLAKADGDVARGAGEGYSLKLAKNSMSISEANGQWHVELPKVQRQSPTEGACPSKGAFVLFNGSNPETFRGGQLKEETLLGVGCETFEKFGDHYLHLEFRTPFMPASRGQKRGNSGVYLQGRYEVQVLDSFGLEGKDNECGGIYKVAEPFVNMCYPPLSWQTYDIEFTAAKYDNQANKQKNASVTIRHNGVTIHRDLELPTHTPGKYQEANEPGPLFLQNHNDPVVFRNVWVVKK